MLYLSLVGHRKYAYVYSAHFSILVFSPIQGFMDPFCLSVRWHDNSLQTQPIDLKLSTHLNEAKSGAKFEDGQNRNKKNSCHGRGTSSKPKLGLWGKK